MVLSFNAQGMAARRMRRGAHSLMERVLDRSEQHELGWYVLAVLGPAAMTYLLATRPPGQRVPLFCYLFVTLLLVRLGGLGPGLVGTLVSTALGNYFLLAPSGTFTLAGGPAELSVLYLLVATTSVIMVHSLRLRARRQARQLDDFLRVAGHELKTPITALTLQMQTLMRQANRVVGQLDRDATLSALQRQAQSVDRLRSLVNHVLDTSRIASSRLDLRLEPTNLLTLVQEVMLRQQDAAAQARCSMTLCADVAIYGMWDRQRLDQVVDNLVTNALKYGSGAPVEVSLCEAEGKAWITDTDHGDGIPAQHQERIFQRFERATTERSSSGLGLGLWLTREIVEASGGSIGVDSAPGQGARFRVCLPLATQALRDLPCA